ncbi:MAG: comR [Actinomycetia bacterium]|nr:comR [Actinomycetes bacterium]
MGRARTFDEDEVLPVTRDQFWSTGYAAARVVDIAAATGLGKGSPYGAFGDKRQLFLRTPPSCRSGIRLSRRRPAGRSRPSRN